MVEYVQDMLGLPVHTLAVLAAGYLAYRVAYTGRDASHKSVDVVFLVFVFAFVAQLASNLIIVAFSYSKISALVGDISASLIGLMLALVAAAGWRILGEARIFRFLRDFGISHSDRHQSAWQSVISKSGVAPSTLIVRKTDGSMLKSLRLADFNDLPFGGCILGQDGSVALYVTHKWPVGADAWQECDPSNHEDWGAKVTIVPASAISEIDLRAA